MKSSRYAEWSRLDNASKIFPATWSLKDPKVFRIACELTGDVDPQLLQAALDKAIEDIPVYKSVLRRGMFWYYLERSDIRPISGLESVTVCAPIYTGQKDNLLFRVSYFKSRINLEVFHALSDGAGALRFFQALITRYMAQTGKIPLENTAAAGGASMLGLMDDSFSKHFVGGGGKKDRHAPKVKGAYHIHGTRFADKRMGLIEGAMPAKKVLCEAHKHGVTLTVYLASLFVYSIGREMRARGRKHPVVLSVPVNLRQYYESVTVRNFFGLVTISCRLDSGSDDLDTVIREVDEAFKKALTRERLDARANKFMALEQNALARIIPLPMKDAILRLFASRSAGNTTSSISNIGKVGVSPEIAPYIRQFSVCTSASRPQMTLCSYGDRLVVSITSPYRETEIQGHFFRLLSNAEIDIDLSSSL